MKTTYINVLGGPGTGKSTFAAVMFGNYKIKGRSVELVTEVAKDLVWEDRSATLAIQPYVSMKQYRNLKRLQGKVETVITDAGLLKDITYGRLYGRDLPESYFQLLIDLHNDLSPNVNLLLEPLSVENYREEGRLQDYNGSMLIHYKIRDTLLDNKIPFITVPNNQREGFCQ